MVRRPDRERFRSYSIVDLDLGFPGSSCDDASAESRHRVGRLPNALRSGAKLLDETVGRGHIGIEKNNASYRYVTLAMA